MGFPVYINGVFSHWSASPPETEAHEYSVADTRNYRAENEKALRKDFIKNALSDPQKFQAHTLFQEMRNQYALLGNRGESPTIEKRIQQLVERINNEFGWNMEVDERGLPNPDLFGEEVVEAAFDYEGQERFLALEQAKAEALWIDAQSQGQEYADEHGINYDEHEEEEEEFSPSEFDIGD